MSISDLIVVMKEGVIQQIGEPQDVYDHPENMFVAKFLGTPPINMFEGSIKGGRLYIGSDAILPANRPDAAKVYVGIRPEGFVLNDNGPLCCKLKGVEVMGRDITVVSENPSSESTAIRSIISAENLPSLKNETVRFSVKPYKVHVFDAVSEKTLSLDN